MGSSKDCGLRLLTVLSLFPCGCMLQLRQLGSGVEPMMLCVGGPVGLRCLQSDRTFKVSPAVKQPDGWFLKEIVEARDDLGMPAALPCGPSVAA